MRLSPTQAQHVRDALGAAVDLVLDGGPTDVGIESTVLSLAGTRPLLLRPGMISQAAIEQHIGPISLADAPSSPDEPDSSPGMREKHYSPVTPLLLTSDPPPGRGAFLWWTREPATSALHSVRMPADPSAYAREIYSVLHRLDGEHLDFIAVEPVPSIGDWAAIHDRLRRAANR
jgi:L-threonylcarbamoyladenylate synthase